MSLRRILYTVPIALSVTVICFLLVHIAPGDPLQMMLEPACHAHEGGGRVEERNTAWTSRLPVQYLLWLDQSRAWRSRHVDLDRPRRRGGRALEPPIGNTAIIANGRRDSAGLLLAGISLGLVPRGLRADTFVEPHREGTTVAIAAIRRFRITGSPS